VESAGGLKHRSRLAACRIARAGPVLSSEHHDILTRYRLNLPCGHRSRADTAEVSPLEVCAILSPGLARVGAACAVFARQRYGIPLLKVMGWMQERIRQIDGARALLFDVARGARAIDPDRID